MAVTEGQKAAPGPGARDYRPAAQRGGREADHRQTEPRDSWLGELLSDGDVPEGISQDGRFRLPEAGSLVLSARGPKANETRAMDQPAASRYGLV